MGRHGGGGGGGGGGSRRSSSSGRRSSGHSTRTSKTPFKGSYNRSYISHGVHHHFYTSDKNYGTKSGWNENNIFILLFVTIHALFMFTIMIFTCINFGSKINGDPNLIKVEDTANILSNKDETKMLELFEKVYDKSGMPIMFFSDTIENNEKQFGGYIENHSEALYYGETIKEDAMIILFLYDSNDNDGEDIAWRYDIYCGDTTTKCLSDSQFNELLDEFEKYMANKKGIASALEYAFNSIYDDLAKTHVEFAIYPIIIFMIFCYGAFYVSTFKSIREQNIAYKYFKEHPEKLSMTPCDSIDIEKTHQIYCPYCNSEIDMDSIFCKSCGMEIK